MTADVVHLWGLTASVSEQKSSKCVCVRERERGKEGECVYVRDRNSVNESSDVSVCVSV